MGDAKTRIEITFPASKQTPINPSSKSENKNKQINKIKQNPKREREKKTDQ